MSRQTYGARELSDLLGVSESMGYKLIRQMNTELAQKGFLTCRGKVPRAYVEERFFGVRAEAQGVTDGKP